MDIVIYSAGPLLERTMKQAEGPSIAINSALVRLPWRPTWFCAGDALAYTPGFSQGKRPSRGYVAQSEAVIHKAQTLHGWSDDLIALGWANLPHYQEIERMSFSITAAYLLAILIGATRIITYGNDRVDTGEKVLGNDGKPRPRYNAARAEAEERERALFMKLAKIPIVDVLCSPR